MKVQSAKPQISNQAAAPIDDLQLEGDFTEAFAELIAAINMDTPVAVDQTAKEVLKFDEVSKKEDDTASTLEESALQDTLSTILYGLNVPVVDNAKLVNQAVNHDGEKEQSEAGTMELKLDIQPLKVDANLESLSSTKIETSKEEKPDLNTAAKPIEKNQEVEALIKLPSHEVQENPEVEVVKSIDAPVTHAVAHTVVQLDQNTLIAQDKPANALQELGKLINQHTNVIQDETKTVNPVARSAASYTQTLDKLSQVEPGMSITKTVAMVGSALKDVYTANIKIHPPELGQVTATLKVDKNTAELVLLTENDHVKAIVQSQLTHLKENFQKADLYLTNVDVQTSHSDAEKQQQQPNPKQTSHMNQGVKQEVVESKEPKTISQRISSLIDTYV